MSVSVSPGPVTTITFRGDDTHNRLSPGLFRDLDRALAEFELDEDAHVAILTGGELAFSAGEDHSARTDDQARVLREYYYPLLDEPPSSERAWATLFARRTLKPVVAAVNGACLGAGLVLMALHTDIRVAGRGAQFGLPGEPGVPRGGEALIARLTAQIPRAAALWLLETGLTIDATRAHEIFLVNEVVPDQQVLERATAIATQIAALPPLAIRAEKLALIHSETASYDDAVLFGEALSVLSRLSSSNGH